VVDLGGADHLIPMSGSAALMSYRSCQGTANLDRFPAHYSEIPE